MRNTNTKLARRVVEYVLLGLSALAIAGCGGGGDEPSAEDGSSTNAAPTISGTASTSATAGTAYSFKPTASDAESDELTFSISGRPAWAAFDSDDGTLSGTPGDGDVATYSGIVISVKDATHAAVSLPAFSITVSASSSGGGGGSTPPSAGACSSALQGTRTFNAGPGQTYPELTDVPWLSLTAGDVVNIYYRSTPYRTKIAIRGSGTANAHIVINGVTDSNCNRPAISGENSEPTTDAVAAQYYNQYSENLGTILIFRGNTSDAYPYGYKPKFIDIQNLLITGGKSSSSYKTQAGGSAQFDDGAAGIYAVTVEDLLVENCEITGNGNGVFVNTKDDEEASASYRVTIRRNKVHLNGNVGRYYEHNLYVQAVRPVYEGNYIGQLIPGALGSSLKDRSSGTIVRYNYIVAAARALDLVESEGGSTSVQVDPLYNSAWVYGNVIVSDDSLAGEASTSLVHWGGDNTPANFRVGTLYFYHNTVITHINEESETHLFDLYSDAQIVELRSNILYHTGSSFYELAEAEGTISFVGTNWITSGWANGNHDWGNGGNSVVVNTSGATLIEGTNPGLQADYSPAAGSPVIDKGAAGLTSFVSAGKWIDFQYVPTADYETRTTLGLANDLGAFERY